MLTVDKTLDVDELTTRGLALAQAVVGLLEREKHAEVVAMALAWLLADLALHVERAGQGSHAEALAAVANQALELAPLLSASNPVASQLM